MPRANGKSQLETGKGGIATQALQHLRAELPPPHSYFWRYVGHPRQVSLPDIHGCVYGLFVAFEIKQPGKDPTPRQIDSMEVLHAAHALTCVIRSLDDLRPIIRYLKTFVADHGLMGSYPPFGPLHKIP